MPTPSLKLAPKPTRQSPREIAKQRVRDYYEVTPMIATDIDDHPLPIDDILQAANPHHAPNVSVQVSYARRVWRYLMRG